jgi:Fe-S-cluster containining protein
VVGRQYRARAVPVVPDVCSRCTYTCNCKRSPNHLQLSPQLEDGSNLQAVYAESVPERLAVYVPVCGWYGIVLYGMLFGIYACGGLVYLFVRSCVVVVGVWMQMQL